MDLDPLNPISSFLKTLNLEDSRSISVLSVIADTNLDLSNLGLEEVFMHQPENQPTIKKMMSSPPPPPSYHHCLFFFLHLLSLTAKLVLFIHQTLIQNTCLPLMMFPLLNGIKSSLPCIHGVRQNSILQILPLPKTLLSSSQDSQEE